MTDGTKKPKKPLFRWREAIMGPDGPDPTTRHVLHVISFHMDVNGHGGFPGLNTIAQETGYSRRAVTKHLAIAREQGWVRSELRVGKGAANHSGGRFNYYIPMIPSPPPDVGHEVPYAEAERRADDDTRRASGDQRRAYDDLNVGHEVPPNSSGNSSKNSSSNTAGDFSSENPQLTEYLTEMLIPQLTTGDRKFITEILASHIPGISPDELTADDIKLFWSLHPRSFGDLEKRVRERVCEREEGMAA